MADNEIREMPDSEDEPMSGLQKEPGAVDPSKVEDSPEKAKETTRSNIALFYVISFFGVIVITFLIGLIQCFEVKDYRDMLITVSGILSGPLGFIIGYYFKSASAKD